MLGFFRWPRLAFVLASCLLAGVVNTAAAAPADKPRVFVLTDIANEPDDEESFVRFLLYADDFDIEGIAATTSVWQKDQVHPERLRATIAAYGEVLPNLRVHDPAYPDAAVLLSRVTAGPALYGLNAVGQGHDSAASEALIRAVDSADKRPLWVTVWGGANVLAQALWKVEHSRSPEAVADFVACLRVYSISDQDDSGAWLRNRYPKLFWIASVHAFSHYSTATWIGISGEDFYHFSGPDPLTVSHDWLSSHIRKGPLGSLYPDYMFIMEGDTPSFLYLIPNGLGDPEHPDYGSWGGRYGRVNDGMGHYSDVVDNVTGSDGRPYRSNQATIWRWREAYQNDFAARMAWTMTGDYGAANHAPLVTVNGDATESPLEVTARPGDTLTLDASGTTDPDGNTLHFSWWHYKEPEVGQDAMQVVPELAIDDASAARVQVHVPADAPSYAPRRLHLILQVSDNGTPALTRYRRVIVTVKR